MKKKITPEKKCLLILGVFSLIAFIIFLPVSIIKNMYGLTIGWTIGCIASLINTFLLFKSGHVISDSATTNKSGVGISLGFYGLRFLIIIGAFVLCAVLDYYLKIAHFQWSIFTCAASVLPSSIIIVIFYHSNDEDKKIEKK